MIFTGTCSWTEKTLIQSGKFYPKEARTAEARLRYYAENFDTVEVDEGISTDKRRMMTGHRSCAANEIYTHPSGADTLDSSRTLSEFGPEKF